MRARVIPVPQFEGAELPGLRDGPGLIAEWLARSARGRSLSVDWVQVPPSADDRAARYRQVRQVAEAVAARVVAARAQGELAIVVGGDHSIALGTAAGLRRATAGKIGLIWVDAHPDLHTPTTTISGRIHGMVVAAIAGYGDPRLVGIPPAGAKIPVSEIALVGSRDFEPGEQQFLAAHPELEMIGVRALRDLGIPAVVESLARRWRDVGAVHLSFDLDSVDPVEAPGVSTPVVGGLSRAEAISLVRALVAELPIAAVDLVEFLPAADDGRTLDLALTLVEMVIRGQQRRGETTSEATKAKPAA